MRRRGRVVAVVTAGLVIGGAGPVGAGAATVNGTKVVHTNHFAGYEVAAAATQASVTFALPTITCSTETAGITAFTELDNFTTNDFTSGGVTMTCTGGRASYVVVAEINNTFYDSAEQVAAGNLIGVELQASSSSTTVTVRDLTNDGSTTDTVSGPGGGGTFTSVSFGTNGVGSPKTPPPTFGSISYGAAQVNATNIGAVGGLTGYAWYTKGSPVVTTSVINSGNAFTTTQAP